MRTKAFTKEIRRSITRSMSRFWAIIIIVALGAGFYASLRSIAPDMRLTIDHYFDEQHVMDLHGISTMGFTDGDIEALESLEEIDQKKVGNVLLVPIRCIPQKNYWGKP